VSYTWTPPVNVKEFAKTLLRLKLLPKKYGTWRSFFSDHGSHQVSIRYHKERLTFVTVEELYSHFRSRMEEELREKK